jgi:hypothetical protein
LIATVIEEEIDKNNPHFINKYDQNYFNEIFDEQKYSIESYEDSVGSSVHDTEPNLDHRVETLEKARLKSETKKRRRSTIK